jgi:hypothetical protein
VKVAVTDWAADMGTEQVLAVEVQAPTQPEKMYPLAGVAVKFTVLAAAKEAEQVPLAQEIPVGALVIVPDPVTVTANGYDVATGVNVAVTARDCDIVTEQVFDVPEQAPTQPEKACPLGALAVKVTELSLVNEPVQVPLVQEIPVGELKTVPDPVMVTAKGYFTTTGLNLALTEREVDIAKVQVVDVPVQAPVQSENS